MDDKITVNVGKVSTHLFQMKKGESSRLYEICIGSLGNEESTESKYLVKTSLLELGGQPDSPHNYWEKSDAKTEEQALKKEQDRLYKLYKEL